MVRKASSTNKTSFNSPYINNNDVNNNNNLIDNGSPNRQNNESNDSLNQDPQVNYNQYFLKIQNELCL
jgi:hypothetical protein